MPETRSYISKVTIPQGTFYIKDAEARDLIAAISGQIQFHLSTNAATTPAGVTWDNGGTLVTGTLAAATNEGTAGEPAWVPTTGYYLVPQTNASGQDYYSEYIVVDTGSATSTGTYAWEKIGDTEIDFSSLGALAYKDSVTLNKSTDKVLGKDTTFSISGGSVTFSNGTSDTFVKSYPGSTQKLETTSITGTNGTVSVSQVTKTSKSVHNIVLGTDTTASKVTKTSKTATNLVLGTATTASKATAGTAVSVAKKGSSVNTSRITLASGQTSIIGTATVDTSTETLSFGTSDVTQSSVIGCDSSTQSITPYSFSDVTVPVVTSNDAVNFDAVSSITDVTVPVVSSDTTVSFDAVASITNVNAAKIADSATVVATGSTTASDANGDSVLTGLGTPTTASAVTGLGTNSLSGASVSVGTNDEVTALTDSTSVTVS